MLWCNVTASKKTSNTFQAFHFLVFLLLVTVEWRALLLPGFPPTFEQARVLRKRLEKAWRLTFAQCS